MRVSRWVAVSLFLVSCGEPARLSEARIHLSFPGARPDGTLPFEPGGSFDIQLIAEVPDLVGPMRARVFLVPVLRPEGSVGETVVGLRGEPGGGRAIGSGRLSWPGGGAVAVRAELGEFVDEQLANLDEARLAIQLGSSVHEGSFVGVPVCVETSATKGLISLKAKNGTFAPMGDTVQLPLKDARCPGFPLGEGGHFKSVTATVSTGSKQVEVDATLDDTGLSAHAVQDVAALQDLVLDIEANPPVLPPAGQVIEVFVTARNSGVAVANVPVSLELAPTAVVLPAQIATDAQGIARFSIIAPEGMPHLRVDAVSGGVRHGITLAP